MIKKVMTQVCYVCAFQIKQLLYHVQCEQTLMIKVSDNIIIHFILEFAWLFNDNI